jgi:hypothetical protein
MLAIAIRNGKLERIDIDQSLGALQSIVGGYIEPFFDIESKRGRSISGYVNEEGFVCGLPIHFGVVHSPDYIVPLAGDAVIVATDSNGATQGLTEAEADLLTRAYRPAPHGVCPVLEGPATRQPVMFVPVDGVLNLHALRA